MDINVPSPLRAMVGLYVQLLKVSGAAIQGIEDDDQRDSMMRQFTENRVNMISLLTHIENDFITVAESSSEEQSEQLIRVMKEMEERISQCTGEEKAFLIAFHNEIKNNALSSMGKMEADLCSGISSDFHAMRNLVKKTM